MSFRLTLLFCERVARQMEASWSWLVLRWWLGVAGRAGVKVERPERRVDDDLDAGEGRHRMKQWSDAVGPLSGKVLMAVLVWLVTWAVLHLALRNRPYETRRALVISLVLIGLGVLGTFPLFFQAFGG
jgi:hypothetical protein